MDFKYSLNKTHKVTCFPSIEFYQYHSESYNPQNLIMISFSSTTQNFQTSLIDLLLFELDVIVFDH